MEVSFANIFFPISTLLKIFQEVQTFTTELGDLDSSYENKCFLLTSHRHGTLKNTEVSNLIVL